MRLRFGMCVVLVIGFRIFGYDIDGLVERC